MVDRVIGTDQGFGATTNFPAIYTFNLAVAAAELTRQTSYASAFATFSAAGFSAAAFAAYKSAILAADTAYLNAVQAAGKAVAAGPPQQPVNQDSSQTALLPQNTELSIGLMY